MPSLSEVLERIPHEADAAARAALCEQALAQVRREEQPQLWAGLQGALAASLAHASRRRFTEESFRRVLDGYQAALSVFTKDAFAEEWADTLRNIAATHLDAAASGLDGQMDHVEAAIMALAQAASIPRAAAPSAWLGAHHELAEALSGTAEWRGASAFAQAAAIYHRALGELPKEEDPEAWASLNAAFAESLLATGDADALEAAIAALERSLEVFTPETHASHWAQAQLALGGLLRGRAQGIRADNLERAVAALDAALTVFTREAFPDQWLQAHYHRGPALVFRQRGDRNDNLRRALDSLHAAIDHIARDDAPEVWASLQIVLAQAHLDRTDGDRQAHIERALPALDVALAALPAEQPSASRVLGLRFFGEACLQRDAGDEDENVDRGIAALEAAQAADTPPADLDPWVVAQSNLGQAYARRQRGDAAANRAQAVRTLATAVSAPLDALRSPDGWCAAQAWLTLVAMKAPDHRFPPRSERGADAAPRDDHGIAAYAALHAGEQPLAIDPHWHVPFQLEQDAVELQRRLSAFLNDGAIPVRSALERTELEGKRHWHVRSMVHQLHERQLAARRTGDLLREIQQEGRPFVLFLRGFNNRIARFAEGAVVSGTGNLEQFAIRSLVKDAAPLPVVWIANPVDSTALDLLVSDEDADGMGYRIESGEDWAQHVRALIASASFIVMHNRTMTPGVASEIALLAELERLDSAFFHDASAANQAAGRPGCRPLDGTALDAIRTHTQRRTPAAALPPPMCPWVGGARRETMEREAEGVRQLSARLTAANHPLLGDLLLDTSAWLLACEALLERPDGLARCLAHQAALFKGPVFDFTEAATLAGTCAQLSTTISRGHARPAHG